RAGAQPDQAETQAAEHERVDVGDGVDLIVRVRDHGGEPVRGASVWVRTDRSWIEGQSDIRGIADFENLPAGAARLQIVATGWNSSGSSVDLDGGEMTIDVALEPRAAPKTGVRGAVGGGNGEQPTSDGSAQR
ncbi:MAG: carboxypeptidase regulatory-like domain-containing protein, partial [Myxococcales bacterium]